MTRLAPRVWLLAFVVCTSWTVLAQQVVPAGPPPRAAGPSGAPPPTSGTSGLAGRVTNEQGQAVRRATVTVRNDTRMERATVTDDDGRFAFADLPAGRFTITASKAGHPEMSYGATRPFRRGAGLVLTAGQHVDDLAIKLPAGAVITGTVFDEHNEPMPGVGIMAYEIRTSLSGERSFELPPTGSEWVTTDEHGSYRVYGLPPGDYTVGTFWAYRPSPAVRVPTDAEIAAVFGGVAPPAPTSPTPAPQPLYSYPAVFHPDALNPLDAAVVTLGAGEVRDGVDLHMRFEHGVSILGRITGGDGSRLNYILAHHSAAEALRTTRFSFVNDSGEFDTGTLTPGSFTIAAITNPGADKMPKYAISDVTVTGAETEPIVITLALQPAMTLSGTVVFDAHTLTPPKDFKGLQLLFGAADDRIHTGMERVDGPDAQGHFTITGVAPGVYGLRTLITIPTAPDQPHWAMRSVAVDGRETTDLPFDISSGASPAIVVTLTDIRTSLGGVITTRSGEPASNYFVVAFPVDETYWHSSRRIVSVRPDVNGHYLFRDLPPGDYHVAATTDLVESDLRDRGALQLLVQQAVTVTVKEGEQKTFDFKIGG